MFAIELNERAQIGEGEFFIFVGASGCGKSTLLRIMSGLEKSYDGTVTYADGGTQSWVDNNWGCKKPEPALAQGLPELSQAITIALANRPKPK